MLPSTARNLVVVGGERYWHDLFPAWHVIYCRLQTTRWVIRDGRLLIANDQELTPVDAVLWRVGVIRPEPWHRAVLDLIRLAGVPCINSADSLLRGFDKLSMMVEMAKAGLPNISATIAAGPQSARLVNPAFPCVLKVGSHHGGLGKARVSTPDQWQDLIDVISLLDDYAVVEPFIDYTADVRCLAVGDRIWCMRRDGTDWKVNRGTATPHLIDPPQALATWARQAAYHLGSSVVGLDFLQTSEGSWHLLECNDIPGLSGFPDVVREAVATEVERTYQSTYRG